MPSHNQQGRPGKNNHARPTQAKPHMNRTGFNSRLSQLDPATLVSAGHLLVLVTSLVSALFGLRLLYKLGLLALLGVHGWSLFGAWKVNGKKIGVELVQQPTLPYFFLAGLLFWFTRVPLFPLQIALGLHSGLALLKAAANNQAAAAHPGFRAQTAQLKEVLRVSEPNILAISSHLELISVPWSVIKALSGAQSLLLPIFTIQLVRFLQLTQPRMQAAWKTWCDLAITGVSWAERQPGVPPSVKALLLQTKAALSPKSSPAAEKTE